MSTESSWFQDLPVLGRMPLGDAATKLRDLGDEQSASELEAALSRGKTGGVKTFGGLGSIFGGGDKPWAHTAHAFGYIAPADMGNGSLPIAHAGNIKSDGTLKNGRISITLDALRVADYPGGGMHQVLFDFYAQHQTPGTPEHVHYNATYRVREGEQAGVINLPIFVGLNVGESGVAFKCLTVNVKNEDDEKFLAFLDSDVFKAGLKLATVAQPAIAPFAATAKALTEMIGKRNRNVPVQDIQLGLDFSRVPTGARLAEGSYLAVQIPETLNTVWRWDDWVFDQAAGRVVAKSDPTRLIPHNYLIFGVSRYDGA